MDICSEVQKTWPALAEAVTDLGSERTNPCCSCLLLPPSHVPITYLVQVLAACMALACLPICPAHHAHFQ